MSNYYFADLINRSYIDEKISSNYDYLIEMLMNIVIYELDVEKKMTIDTLKKRLTTFYYPLKSYGTYLQTCNEEYNGQILLNQAKYLEKVLHIINSDPNEIKDEIKNYRMKVFDIRKEIQNRKQLTKNLNEKISEFKKLKNSLIKNTNWTSG